MATRTVNSSTAPLTALLVFLFTTARDTTDESARAVACAGLASFVGGSLVEGQPATMIDGAEEWKVDRANDLLKDAFPGITRGTKFITGGGDDVMQAAIAWGIGDLPREEIVKRLRAAFPEKSFSDKPAGHKVNLGCTFGWLADQKAKKEKAEHERAVATLKAAGLEEPAEEDVSFARAVLASGAEPADAATRIAGYVEEKTKPADEAPKKSGRGGK